MDKMSSRSLVQVLVAAMNQSDHSLLEKMNIQTDVIVGNQCNFNSIESFAWNGHNATYLNFNEKGVGLNRNNALMRARGKYCLFADDDLVYEDGYEKTIVDSFQKYPDADVIVFNLHEPKTARYVITKSYRVNYLNYLRFGTARVAVKLESIRENGIFFNLCFGGGTEHSHGEDNLFLTDCLKKGLRIYAVPQYIETLTEERPSTWNNGYGEKYFRDQGALYKQISPRWWKLLCLQDAIRHKNMYQSSSKNIFRKMTQNKK